MDVYHDADFLVMTSLMTAHCHDRGHQQAAEQHRKEATLGVPASAVAGLTGQQSGEGATLMAVDGGGDDEVAPYIVPAHTYFVRGCSAVSADATAAAPAILTLANPWGVRRAGIPPEALPEPVESSDEDGAQQQPGVFRLSAPTNTSLCIRGCSKLIVPGLMSQRGVWAARRQLGLSAPVQRLPPVRHR